MINPDQDNVKSPAGLDRGKPQRLLADLRADIENGQLREGDKLRSIRELAGVYEISFESVRQVFHRLEQMNVVRRRQGSGTFVAPRPAPDASRSMMDRSVALMFDNEGHVYSKISNSLVRLLQEHHLSAMTFVSEVNAPNTPPPSVREVVERWSEAPPRAVVVNWCDINFYESLERLRKISGCRMIAVVDAPVGGAGWHQVATDVERQADLAVDYFLSRGHQRVGLVTYARNIRSADPQAWSKRTAGNTPFIVAMGHRLRQSGKRQNLTILYNQPNAVGHGDPLSETNMDATMRWLDRPDRPTAIVGADFRLQGVIRAAQKLGLSIPGDLELLGLGDTPWSHAYGFDSIGFNEQVIAQRIADLVLMEEKDIGDCAHHILVPPLLHQRKTVN